MTDSAAVDRRVEGLPAWLCCPVALFGYAVVVLGLAIWLPTGITGQDEYWLSLRTPMEMLDTGHLLTPWLNGEPRLQKPPLLYWLIAAGYSVFGVELIAARIWGVLAGAGVAVLTALLSRRMFGGSGLFAGLLAATSIGVAVEARRVDEA